MARKIAELFTFNLGIRLFNAAWRVGELSRGSVLCHLNASFETVISQHHNSIFYAKIDDHGVCRGDTRQILSQWRRLVAYEVALDLLYWAVRSALYRLIYMAFEMTSEGGILFCHRQLFVVHNRS